MRKSLFIFLMPIMLFAFDVSYLQEMLKEAKKISGDFVQTKHLKGFDMPLKSRGTFEINEQNELFWSIVKPTKNSVKITTDGIFELDEKNEWKPSKNRLDKGLFLDFLTINEAGLRRYFVPELTGDKSDWILKLKPKDGILEEIFNSIIIKGNTVITGFEIDEAQGDRSVIEFLNVKK